MHRLSTYLKISSLVLIVSTLFLSCQKENEFIHREPPVAEAGDSQVLPNFITNFSLTGSGTSTNGAITGYLWSLISGPNVPTITSPASATTTVTNAVAGNYIFQFMVMDEAGLTGIDTTHVTIPPANIQSITLQPATNPNERHVWGSATQDQSTFAPELDAGSWTSGSQIGIRGLFKFDLSGIPAGATILTAKLTLYSNPTPLNGDQINANSGSNNAMYIQRITDAWVPASTNWTNQPNGTSTDQVSIPHTSQSMLDLVDVDVKNLVTAMHSGTNNGFRILLQNETPLNIRIFCSSRHALTAKHPKLVITYTP